MATQTRNHSQYIWNEGLDSGLQFGDETYSDRLVDFASSVLSNVNRAIERNTAGDIVHGMSLDKVNDFVTTSQELQQFLSNIDKNSKTYKGGRLGTNAVKDLWNISKKVGVDPSAFMAYFQDYIPKESAKSRNLRARINDDGLEQVTAAELGYTPHIQQYLTENKINLMRDVDGNIYSLNEDYSAYSPLAYLNRDLRLAGKENSGYNDYLFADASGLVKKGNYSNLSADDPLQAAIQNYINTSNEKRGKQYKLFNNFNPYLNYTDENKTVSDFIKRLGAASNLEHSLNNFADVSQMFQGNKQVIAVKQDGTNFNEGDFIDGTLKLDPSYKFFFVGDDGSLQATDWSDPDIEKKIGKYSPEGWGERDNQVGSTLKGLNLGESTIASDQVTNSEQWANRMLDLMSKPRTQLTSDEIRELEKYGSFGNYKNALSYIGSLISETGLKLDQSHLNKWNALTQKFRTDNLILNQNQFNLSDEEQDQKLIEEASKAGYSSVADYKDSQRQPSKDGWSATDVIRLSAIASDLGSLIWSVSNPEVVSNVLGSSALGLTSTGMNAYADFKDKGVSAGDAWKNLILNLGFDTLGVIPGGQSVKIAKNLARILGRNVPTVLGIIQGFNNKEEYEQAFDKLLHNPKELTVKDYQRLSEIVHLAIRGTKTNVGGWRTKPNYTGEKVQFSSLPAARGIKNGVKSSISSIATKFRGIKNRLTGNKRALPAHEEAPKKEQGGKLDRFGEYLKSHK